MCVHICEFIYVHSYMRIICVHAYVNQFITSWYDTRAPGVNKLSPPARKGEKVPSRNLLTTSLVGLSNFELLFSTVRVVTTFVRFFLFLRTPRSRFTAAMIWPQTRTRITHSIIDVEVCSSVSFRTRSMAFFMFVLCDASGAHVSCMKTCPAHFTCSGKCRLP